MREPDPDPEPELEPVVAPLEEGSDAGSEADVGVGRSEASLKETLREWPNCSQVVGTEDETDAGLLAQKKNGRASVMHLPIAFR